jgi:hypothetical protein
MFRLSRGVQKERRGDEEESKGNGQKEEEGVGMMPPGHGKHAAGGGWHEDRTIAVCSAESDFTQ